MPRSVGTFVVFLTLSLVAAAALGGEEPEQKALEDMSIEELRTYQGFYYASGGRDPLTMRLPTAEELGQENKVSGAKIAPTLEQMEMILTKALEDIKAAIKVLNYDRAIQVSEDTIHTVDLEWPPLKADPPQLRQMDEEIRNLNRMATRLKAQEEITREFAAINLRVDGVIWSPTDAKAVINAKLMSAGELLLEERKEGDLRIEMIEEHGVVFQYKGMRFRKPVELYALPAEPVKK